VFLQYLSAFFLLDAQKERIMKRLCLSARIFRACNEGMNLNDIFNRSLSQNLFGEFNFGRSNISLLL
jgi:hypothetical protein